MSPVYSIEIADKMAGSFTNLSCIDAVHIEINSKVNEVLQDFSSKMGTIFCQNNQNLSLELTSGNIRFKSGLVSFFNTVFIELKVEYL